MAPRFLRSRGPGCLAPLGLSCLLIIGCSRLDVVGRFTGKAVGAMFEPTRPIRNKLRDPRLPGARLAATWVGHATVLLQLGEKFVITDPVFTTTIGQLIPRYVEPGLDVEALPELDAVIVSHMHMDHLSLGSLDLIESRTRQLLIPKGGSVYVPRSRVHPLELAAWQYWEHDGLRVTAVPVRHAGWRYGLDRWWAIGGFTGYVVEHDGVRVYFGGDTGYDQAFFRATARAMGHVDLALLPIAPVEPRQLMAPYHVDHREALDALRDLQADVLLPIHYDTFVNSLDDFGAAPQLLDEEARRRNVRDRVKILEHGERWQFL